MILLIDNYDSFSYNLYQLLGELTEKSAAGGKTDAEKDTATGRAADAEADTDAGKTADEVAGRAAGEGTDGDAKESADELRVIRNDAYTVEEIKEMNPDGILLSPGPGRPEDAGVCEEVVRQLGGQIPILGVCLGHQAICEVYGAKVSYAAQLMHGKQSLAVLDQNAEIFRGCGETAQIGRYHSLAAAVETLPPCLKVIAWTECGEVMAVEYKKTGRTADGDADRTAGQEADKAGCRNAPVIGLQFHPESILTPDGPKMLRNWYEMVKEYRKMGKTLED